jgi:hypothetical protein
VIGVDKPVKEEDILNSCWTSMKRIFALSLLIAFAAGPSLKWLCDRTCGAEHPVAAAEDCHHTPESAQMVGSGHDCGDQVSPVALITKRIGPETQSLVASHGAWASGLSALPVSSPGPDFTVADSGPPLSAFLVPLRI